MQPAHPNKQMLCDKIVAGVKQIVLKDVLQSDNLFCVVFAGFDKEGFLM